MLFRLHEGGEHLKITMSGFEDVAAIIKLGDRWVGTGSLVRGDVQFSDRDAAINWMTSVVVREIQFDAERFQFALFVTQPKEG